MVGGVNNYFIKMLYNLHQAFTVKDEFFNLN